MLRARAFRLCAAAGGSATGAAFASGRKIERPRAVPGKQLSIDEQIEHDARPTPVNEDASQQPRTVGTLATVKPTSHAPTRWMEHSAWAALGDEFKELDEEMFLRPAPEGFLTNRAVTDVAPAEELLANHVAALRESYDGLDVRDPKTMLDLHQGDPTYVKMNLGMGDKVRAVAEFMSGHVAHQVALPQWQQLFDLAQVELDLQYWLWVIHLHIISRRAVAVNVNTWARRREVMEEMLENMASSWEGSMTQLIGKKPLSSVCDHIRKMYFTTALNLEEALMHDGPGGDMMLMAALMTFCPLPRPEDVPMFTYYTLVHYIRFHTALFDRIPDEDFAKGNFNFLPPDDRSIFSSYTDVQFDDVIKSWTADGEEPRSTPADAADARSKEPSAGSEGSPAQ